MQWSPVDCDAMSMKPENPLMFRMVRLFWIQTEEVLLLEYRHEERSIDSLGENLEVSWSPQLRADYCSHHASKVSLVLHRTKVSQSYYDRTCSVSDLAASFLGWFPDRGFRE